MRATPSLDSPSYSSRLGRIAPARFQAALESRGLGRFLQAAPIPFGLFGQNVFLTGATA